MNEQYKKDEKLMIDIISNNVKTTYHTKKLKIIILSSLQSKKSNHYK